MTEISNDCYFEKLFGGGNRARVLRSISKSLPDRRKIAGNLNSLHKFRVNGAPADKQMASAVSI